MRSKLFAFVTMLLMFLLTSMGCSVESASRPCSVTVNISDPPPVGWILVDKQAFQFYIPQSLRERKVQGIDSQVWEYRSETIRLNIDYGIYSGFPEVLRREKDYSEQIWCIKGNKALVCAYTNEPPDNLNADEGKWKKMTGMFFLTKTDDEKQASLLDRSSNR